MDRHFLRLSLIQEIMQTSNCVPLIPVRARKKPTWRKGPGVGLSATSAYWITRLPHNHELRFITSSEFVAGLRLIEHCAVTPVRVPPASRMNKGTNFLWLSRLQSILTSSAMSPAKRSWFFRWLRWPGPPAMLDNPRSALRYPFRNRLIQSFRDGSEAHRTLEAASLDESDD